MKQNKSTKPSITNPAILPIEAAAQHYAAERSELAERVAEFEQEVQRLRLAYLPGIKLHAAKAADLQSRLESLIVQNKSLFNDPRTITLHGIKLGLQKGKGKISFDDPDKLVERIRAQLPKAQAESLLKVETTPILTALAQLDGTVLKKLGVTVTGTGDAVVIKAANGDIDKLVERILEEGTKKAA